LPYVPGPPSRPVICIVGDGAARYGITALWTAVTYHVPVTFLMLRNEEYMILKWFAESERIAGAPGLDLPGPRLVQVRVASGVWIRVAAGHVGGPPARPARVPGEMFALSANDRPVRCELVSLCMTKSHRSAPPTGGRPQYTRGSPPTG
jgi:hypothetical protein